MNMDEIENSTNLLSQQIEDEDSMESTEDSTALFPDSNAGPSLGSAAANPNPLDQSFNDCAYPDDAHILIYENAHMISEFETKLVMIFHPASYTIEIACLMLGIREGNTLSLYIDYKALYAAVLQPDIVSKAKKRRRQVAIEFLLSRPVILHGVHRENEEDQDIVDLHHCKLTLRHPKSTPELTYTLVQKGAVPMKLLYEFKEAALKATGVAPIAAVVTGGLSGGSASGGFSSTSNVNVSTKVSGKVDSEQLELLWKAKILEDRLDEELKKLMCVQKPLGMDAFDVHSFYHNVAR